MKHVYALKAAWAVVAVLASAMMNLASVSAQIHGIGTVCNKTYSPVWITQKVGVDAFGNGGRWEVATLGYNQCSGSNNHNDVDAIWARSCASTTGPTNCSLKVFKVGYGAKSVNPGPVSRNYPWTTVILQGSTTGGYDQLDPTWPKPPTDQVYYSFYR